MVVGNVVDCEDKAVVMWRVEKENKRYKRKQIRRQIQRGLPGKKLCFLDDAPKIDDTTGMPVASIS